MLLNISERPNGDFSCFCTLQKGKKEIFHASEHFRKTKMKFSCFCTLQKGKNGVFHASEHFRKAKMKFFMLLNISERLKKEELPLAHNFLLQYGVRRREVTRNFRHIAF